jgi:hypothetical protein
VAGGVDWGLFLDQLCAQPRRRRRRALAGEGKDRFALASAYGDVLRDLGATAESIAAFEEALRSATDDVERCKARIGLARGMRIADRIEPMRWMT